VGSYFVFNCVFLTTHYLTVNIFHCFVRKRVYVFFRCLIVNFSVIQIQFFGCVLSVSVWVARKYVVRVIFMYSPNSVVFNGLFKQHSLLCCCSLTEVWKFKLYHFFVFCHFTVVLKLPLTTRRLCEGFCLLQNLKMYEVPKGFVHCKVSESM